MSLRDRKQLACAISFRDVSLSIAPSPITDEYAARHSHAHCVFLVTFTIIVVSGIVLRPNNRYVGPINCTSSLWKTTPSIKSINYIC